MYPELFSIFGFTISSFGVMMATAFLVGSWITAKRMEEEGLDPDLATTLLLYVMIGGVLGSKLYFAVDVWLREGRVIQSRELPLGSAHWRTYSTKTLWGKGNWSVEARSADDRVLARADFSCEAP